MSIIPPSKIDFIGGDAQSQEHSFSDKHNATGVLLGRPCDLSNQVSYSTSKVLNNSARSRVSSREYFSRRKQITYNWVNQIIGSLTIEQLVGQLLFYSLSTHHDLGERELVEEYIRSYHIGGIRCKQEHPKKRLAWVNHFQAISKYPLLIGEDVKWSFEDDFSLYGERPEEDYFMWGKSIAEYFKYMGVHFAFIPVNQKEEQLSDKKAWLFIKGLQDSSIGVVLRQYLTQNKPDMSTRLPLYGHFASKVHQGDRSFVRMVFESGMSYIVCKELEANDSYVDSQGIVFCDVSDRFLSDFKGDDLKNGIIRSFLGGADGFLLTHASMSLVFRILVRAIEEGEISRELLSCRVKKFLLAKEWAGLHKNRMIDVDYVSQNILAKGYLQSLEAKI